MIFALWRGAVQQSRDGVAARRPHRDSVERLRCGHQKLMPCQLASRRLGLHSELTLLQGLTSVYKEWKSRWPSL